MTHLFQQTTPIFNISAPAVNKALLFVDKIMSTASEQGIYN